MPPRSTKAPKLTTLDTTPLRRSPGLRLSRSARCSFWFSSSQLRRLSTIVAVLVELDDLGFDLVADVRLESRTRRSSTSDAGRNSQADVDDQATLDDLDDLALDHAVGFLEFFDLAPGTLVLGPLLRQDEAAFLVFLSDDKGFDALAHRHDLVGVDVVADAQLTARDDTLALVANVEKDLVLVDSTTVPSTAVRPPRGPWWRCRPLRCRRHRGRRR